MLFAIPAATVLAENAGEERIRRHPLVLPRQRSPISRDHDQPGQGFTIDLASRAIVRAWRPIDALIS